MMLLSLYSFRSCRYCATVFLILLEVVVVEEIVVKVIDDVGENIEILFKFIHNCRYINCVLCFSFRFILFSFFHFKPDEICVFPLIVKWLEKLKWNTRKKMVE